MAVSREPAHAFATMDAGKKIRWLEMRCARCGRLLQKVEEHALRAGKRLEIKCRHCKMVNYLVGETLDETSNR